MENMEDLATDLGAKRDKGVVLLEALADYCGVEVEDVIGYAVGVEFKNGDGLAFTSTWSVNPPWRLGGYLDEIGQAHKRETGS
jgi:hypothetical protein